MQMDKKKNSPSAESVACGEFFPSYSHEPVVMTGFVPAAHD